jgi:formylglycine-generating enzyme required for sulfatase activity
MKLSDISTYAAAALIVCALSAPSMAGAGGPGEMVFVEGGCFEMGDPFEQKHALDGDPDEKPVHEVCLDDYYIGRYEVTVGEFREFVEATGYRTDPEKDGLGCFTFEPSTRWVLERVTWDDHTFDQGEDHPVVCVSWNDAAAFAGWKSEREGKVYRLPTEAEWEYAAKSRGEVNHRYPWGDGEPSGNFGDVNLRRAYPDWPWRVWEEYDDGYLHTAPVGSFAPNRLGVYDISGNVWEWVDDWYNGGFYGHSPVRNPRAPRTDNTKIRRGGGWSDDMRHTRIVNRSRNVPLVGRFDLGFRLVMEAD